MDATRQTGTRLYGLVLRVSTVWAIAGGVLLLAVVIMNVASIVGSATIGHAVPGDFEMTEMGVAIAAFSFLPYCQIAGLNVTADIFTANASRFWLSLFALLAAVVAMLFGVILLRQMYLGMLDQKEYEYTTAILQIPVWWGYAVVLISLALLVVASLASLIDAVRNMAKG